MKIRITGTREECAAAAELIKTAFDERETSSFRPNDRTPGSKLGRVYIDAELPGDARV